MSRALAVLNGNQVSPSTSRIAKLKVRLGARECRLHRTVALRLDNGRLRRAHHWFLGSLRTTLITLLGECTIDATRSKSLE
eukprot:11829946-Alexandrium_andersonii.AAC.1